MTTQRHSKGGQGRDVQRERWVRGRRVRGMKRRQKGMKNEEGNEGRKRQDGDEREEDEREGGCVK